MSRIKQLHLDIIDSQEPDEDGIINSIPNPIPSNPEITDAEVSTD